jgi:hypothetical protein
MGARRPRSPYFSVGFAWLDCPFNEDPSLFREVSSHHETGLDLGGTKIVSPRLEVVEYHFQTNKFVVFVRFYDFSR